MNNQEREKSLKLIADASVLSNLIFFFILIFVSIYSFFMMPSILNGFFILFFAVLINYFFSFFVVFKKSQHYKIKLSRSEILKIAFLPLLFLYSIFGGSCLGILIFAHYS